MITRPTVLVLGAGASAPYGFPVARELKQPICSAFVKDSVAVRLLHEGSKIPRSAFVEFRDAFYKAGQSSVDAFLEHRPEFIEVGKLAIACCLMPYESEDALFECNGSRGGDWYQYLSEKLNASFEKFGENELSIITFNYDRSLEHYLYTTLRNGHGMPRDDCLEMIAQIPVHHMYGQISRHPYSHADARPYLPDRNTYEQIVSAASGISLLHEKIAGRSGEIRHCLLSAEVICFLGFGFHPLNLGRLRLRDSSNSRSIFAAARGLIGGEIEAVRAALRSILVSPNATVDDVDNLALLRFHQILA